ncbi:MAG: hypothetical protein ACLU84_02360 [Clostridia bacterium]
MLVSENGRMMELPDDIRVFDEYKMYGKTLVVHYVNKKYYSIYYQTDSGLELKESEIKSEVEFYKPNYIAFVSSKGDDVLYNTTNGVVIAYGNFQVPEYSNFDIYEGPRFNAIILKFYEEGIEKYRVFNDKGDEVLDSAYVGRGKKVELLTYKSFGNIMPLRIRIDKFCSDRKGVLHIVFNEESTEVIEVLPSIYDKVDLNLYAAVKDNAGRIHYPTYTAVKNGKASFFTFAGKRLNI